MDGSYRSRDVWITLGEILPELRHYYRQLEFPEYTMADLVIEAHKTLLEYNVDPAIAIDALQERAHDLVWGSIASIPSRDFVIQGQAENDYQLLVNFFQLLWPYYRALLIGAGLYDNNGMLWHRQLEFCEYTGDVYLRHTP